jgi:hypothetical protein
MAIWKISTSLSSMLDVPQGDAPLTARELLAAELVDLGQRFLPSGQQVAVGLRLDRAVAAVDALFTERGLPKREDLIGELALWRRHAEDGLSHVRRTEDVLDAVIRRIGAPEQPTL